MIIEITARHDSVNDAIKQHAEEKLRQAIRLAEHDVVSAHVILDHEKSRQSAEMIVHGRHLTATVHAESEDAHSAVDRAAEKLRHQLEKHHDKRIARKRRRASQAETELAAMQQAAAVTDEDVEPAPLAEEARNPAPVEVQAADGPELEEATGAESDVDVHRHDVNGARAMTVHEACLAFATEQESVFLFRDSDSKRLGVLYRRRDGRLGLIDTGAA